MNSVCQGPVLGPPFLNVHDADLAPAVLAEGFQDVVFADDPNYSRVFELSAARGQVEIAFRLCQGSLHRWGAAHTVAFDPRNG